MRQFTINICFAIAVALLAYDPTWAQVRKHIESEVSKSEEESPVTTTTISKEVHLNRSLQDWVEQNSGGDEISSLKNRIINGYEAILFTTVANGRLQRGLAVNLGDGRVFTHLTTNPRATGEEMFEAAKDLVFSDSLQTTLATSASYDPCNCVSYARSQVPSIPTSVNLSSYDNKVRIINHRFARTGSVAVINVGNNGIGHVAVVRNVAVNFDGSLQLTLQEANWEKCKVTYRTGTPIGLKVEGYFDPTYTWGTAHPKLGSLSPTSGPTGGKWWTTAIGSGFDQYNTQAILLGGSWCTTFAKCVIPNDVMTSKSSSSMRVPLTINGRGSYTLYFFNPTTGKTSNGKPISIY